MKHGLVTRTKRDKEIFYATTDEGHEVGEQYRVVLDRCLVPGVLSVDGDSELLSEIATTTRTLSGLYDQAAESATSIS